MIILLWGGYSGLVTILGKSGAKQAFGLRVDFGQQSLPFGSVSQALFFSPVRNFLVSIRGN